jgi:transcriptional regulator with XRE-family HTH domain
MTKDQLKAGRLKAGLTQVKAAAKLGLSQPYLSLLESGARRVTAGVAHAAANLYGLEPLLLATPEPPRLRDVQRRLPHQLAALGYPGYSHLRKSPPPNPALVALEAVTDGNLDGRVAEALPWVLERHPRLDWKGLVTYAKLQNAQNRLGFFVTLARELADARSNAEASAKLKDVEKELELSKLAAETTLGRDSMPESEKEWLRKHRPSQAERWNVLTGMRTRDLPYAGGTGDAP